MPAKPGTRPPNAGKRGRKPGTPNAVTRTTREMFSAFVDHNAAKAQELFDRVARKNPARALQILSSFSDFVLSRMQRTEISGQLNHGQPYAGDVLKVVDSVEASRVYAEMMGGGRDPRSVEFVVSEPKPAAASRPAPKVVPEPKPLVQAPPAAENLTDGPVPVRPAPAPLKLVPAPADPADDSVVLVLTAEQIEDAAQRHFHEHRPLSDSACPQCRHLWVIS